MKIMPILIMFNFKNLLSDEIMTPTIDIQPEIFIPKFSFISKKESEEIIKPFNGFENIKKVSLDFSLNYHISRENTIPIIENYFDLKNLEVSLLKFNEIKKTSNSKTLNFPEIIPIEAKLKSKKGFNISCSFKLNDKPCGKLKPGCQFISIHSKLVIKNKNELKNTILNLRSLFNQKKDEDKKFFYRFKIVPKKNTFQTDTEDLEPVFTEKFYIIFSKDDLSVKIEIINNK